MSRALSAARRSPRFPLSPGLTSACPAPARLAALGTVLCLHHADVSELSGWHQAVAAHACQGVDSEGLRESLCFTDARGRCCWRLYLLPDSDFLAWDQLAGELPGQSPREEQGPVGERLWRRLAGHLRGQRWRACALRLHACPGGHGLAASLVPLSSLGAAMARRIARLEGTETPWAALDAGPGAPAGLRA